ncbi:MAG: hypothetical protein A3F83_03510 [Candidatus Glassbacteria bacterium RIFCSPLOWO2_12_FULL_58_11]|uniref:Dockerin domain-containing protein n=1 Tax=Candidatus Glassbacteria bacterium RIFCSPLOWO2_12_FULL_58_11 TaxID=1817867 RepID=A0A1F5YX34_9BACT|nr:MAG: hypothetical protein A3F83_03510 [Candidatus Glassbacteria bacterium RIFCSPLOWO2_12_FULL_58_11]
MTFLRTVFRPLILLCLSAGALAAARPFPPTVYDSLRHRSVIVFMDQLHSRLSDKEARFAAAHYVGTQKMRRQDIDLIRQYNENFLHWHYKLGVTVDSIADYGMVLSGDWFSDNRSPLSNWGQVRTHPDWFLLNRQNQWVVHGGRRMVMDISNAGFRQWWVDSCIEEMKANGCDGVFADTYSIPAIFGRTTYPELFEDVNQTINTWIPKLNDYGNYVFARLDSAGFYFFPNIDNLQTTWDNNAGTHYVKGDYLHGAMMESWGDWASVSDATLAMNLAVAIQKKGCFLHGEGYFGSGIDMNPSLTEAQKRMWLAGTYLLTNHGRMYLSMYGPDEESLGMSGRLLWYPEFEIDLGAYTQEWSNLAQLLAPGGIFRRNFEKGFVLLNMADQSRTASLGGTYYLAEDDGTTSRYWMEDDGTEHVGLKYTPVSSVVLPAISAAILLNEPPGCLQEPRGDFDGDGALGAADVLEMVRAMLSGGSDPCLDFNSDSRANILDAVSLMIKLFHQ